METGKLKAVFFNFWPLRGRKKLKDTQPPHMTSLWLKCWQPIAFLNIKQTQSNIRIHPI